jgi:hypothetical protein
VRFRWAIALVLAACGPSGDPASPDTQRAIPPPAEPPSSAKPLPRIAPAFEASSLARAIDTWPIVVPGVFSRSVTSYDRSGGNEDGFGGTYSTAYEDARGDSVIFDEVGPGVLRTLWFTSASDGASPLGLGAIRFTFDDEPKPRIDIDADALFAGATPPFVAPLAQNNARSNGGFASWVSIPFRSRLRIAVEKRPGFVQLHWDALPPDWDVASYTPAIDEATRARFAAGPSDKTLEEVPLDVTRTGPGTFDVLRFVPSAPATDASLQTAHIDLWFDGEHRASLPLAMFFGSGRGLARIQSVAWTMEPSLFESRIPMPFTSSARIAITGIAGKLFHHASEPLDSAAPLEIVLRDENPTTSGRDFVYADVEGSGKLVATVLGIDPAAVKQWWEGDLRTRIDGARSPALHGTGHEDDHLGGWSNEFLLGPFSLPMQGAPRTDVTDPNPAVQINGATTLYRLWPGVTFLRSVRHTTEHGTSNGRAARYTSATFLYRRRGTRLVKTDTSFLDGIGNSHAVTSAFEGEDATPITADVRTFERANVRLAIDPANDGVVLRRWFDRIETPMEANVEVDGFSVRTVRTTAPWAESRRFAEEDLFIPAQITRGKAQIEVRWVSAGSSTAVSFEAWSVKRGD